MKRSQYFFIGLILFSPLTPLFFLSPVQGIGFSCSELWFFVDQPTILDYDEMSFSVYNNHLHPVHVECTVEQVEGVNISVGFDWNSVTLNPEEKQVNHYHITS